MSADRVIEILAREGTFNARRLSFHFPAHVMDELSIGGALFFARLADGSASVSLDQFIDGAWLTG